MNIGSGMSEKFAARVRRLRAEFIATFAERARMLEELAAVERLDLARLGKVRTEVHQLRGSAGMYQLEKVFEAACAAEEIVDRMLEAMRAGRSTDLDLGGALAPLLVALSHAGD